MWSEKQEMSKRGISAPARQPDRPLFLVRNEAWIIRELPSGSFELVSASDDSQKIAGTAKALASAAAVLSELARYVSERR